VLEVSPQPQIVGNDLNDVADEGRGELHRPPAAGATPSWGSAHPIDLRIGG
jgi:hypothetical protein